MKIRLTYRTSARINNLIDPTGERDPIRASLFADCIECFNDKEQLEIYNDHVQLDLESFHDYYHFDRPKLINLLIEAELNGEAGVIDDIIKTLEKQDTAMLKMIIDLRFIIQ